MVQARAGESFMGGEVRQVNETCSIEECKGKLFARGWCHKHYKRWRAVEFGGQALAIGVSGLMETFLPSGSTLGDPSKSWLGKLASGYGAGSAQ